MKRLAWGRQPKIQTGAAGRWKRRGLLFFYNGAAGYVDQVSGRALTPVNTPARGTTWAGEGFVANSGSTQYVNAGNPDNIKNITGSITVGVLVRHASGNNSMLFTKDKDTGGRPWTLSVVNFGSDPYFYIEGGGGSGDAVTASGAMGAADGKIYCVVGRWRASDKQLSIWVNGTQRASSTTSTSALTAATANVLIGRREYSGFEQNYDGTFLGAFIVSGALTDGEIQEISRNFWTLAEPRNEPTFFLGPAAGGAHTLSGAVVESTTDTASGAIAYQHTLGGAATESATDTASGSISYTHTLGGAASESTEDSASGSITIGADVAYLGGAVVEGAQDSASGAISYIHALTGAVVETGSDTASGALLGTSFLGGTIVEGFGDYASGALDNPDAIVVRPQGGGKSKPSRRRRVMIGDKTYEVPERDVPALLEAVLRSRRPPATAVPVAVEVKPQKPRRKAAVKAVEALPEPVSVDLMAERIAALQADLRQQAETEMLALLDRVASRVMAEMQDEEDSVIALLMA